MKTSMMNMKQMMNAACVDIRLKRFILVPFLEIAIPHRRILLFLFQHCVDDAIK